jgi:alginate O-acetyltransferase complex protein AlgI
MLFNSFGFLVFFPIVVSLYFATPYRFRWVLLLGASYYFYMASKPEHVILIILSTLINYFAGLLMSRTNTKPKPKKLLLILSIISNLGILFSFKYLNFFSDSVRAIFEHLNVPYNVPAFNVLVPLGISFYTLQSMSYIIDVYRGRLKPEKHLGIFALHVAFFPQLVAGPIGRSGSLLPQFYEKHDFDYQRVTDGLKRMAWGFFQKLVIADRLAIIVDQVYNDPTAYSGVPLIVATYLFAFQIYSDFSGYSDIAIGAAQVMGFKLMDNFKQPYFSESISEFWARWHISLSQWLRDYIFYPLRRTLLRRNRSTDVLSLVLPPMVTMLASGLWHGANWTFVVWGGLHGLYLIFSILTKNTRQRIQELLRIDRFPLIHKVISIVVAFHLVTFAWVFFRANSLSDAIYIVSHLIPNVPIGLHYNLGLRNVGFAITVLAILLMEMVHVIQTRGSVRDLLRRRPLVIRWSVYNLLLLWIIFCAEFGGSEFIYTQF